MRNINVVVMDILTIFYIIIFEILENPRKLSDSRARDLEPLPKWRELAQITSKPQSAAFGIPVGSDPNFGGARSRNGGLVG